MTAGFESCHKSTVNMFISMWNASFGKEEKLAYPSSLESILRRLQPYVEIQLPAFPQRTGTKVFREWDPMFRYDLQLTAEPRPSPRHQNTLAHKTAWSLRNQPKNLKKTIANAQPLLAWIATRVAARGNWHRKMAPLRPNVLVMMIRRSNSWLLSQKAMRPDH